MLHDDEVSPGEEPMIIFFASMLPDKVLSSSSSCLPVRDQPLLPSLSFMPHHAGTIASSLWP